MMNESSRRSANQPEKFASSQPEKGRSNESVPSETSRPSDSAPAPIGPFTMLPMRFGRYVIQKELGRGQMGAVYLAKDRELDRLVALKVARVSGAGSGQILKRMEVEAKSAAKIDHPLICKVYDAGEIDGIRFIALQYIEGEDLKQYMTRVGRKLPVDESVRLIVQILRALEAAHAQGVIHRDLKPSNVMLNKNHEPVIMDFGLARQTIASSNAGLTQGMIVGTAAYMSPEQATGKAEEIDHRSDIYAVGAMLFEMLTGEWPFVGGAMEVMGQKCVQDPPSPLGKNPALNPKLADVCHTMIARQKIDRFVTCDEVLNALNAIDDSAVVPSEFPPVLQAKISTIMPPASNVALDFAKEPSFELSAQEKAKHVGGNKSRQSILVRYLSELANWWNNKTPVARMTALGAMAACFFLSIVTLYFQNGDTVVRVKVVDENVEVTFQNETLTLTDGTHNFNVRPGEQTLHIKIGGAEFDTDKFTIKKNANSIVTVEVVDSKVVSKLGDQVFDRHSLPSHADLDSNVIPATATPNPPDMGSELSKDLQELKPGFDDKVTPKIGSGEFDVPKTVLSDLDKVAIGKWIPLVNEQTKLADPDKMTFENGVLEMHNTASSFGDIVARNVIVRAKVCKLTGSAVGFEVRAREKAFRYWTWFHGADDGGDFHTLYRHTYPNKKPKADELASAHRGAKVQKGQFVEMAFAAIGDVLTVYVEGKRILTVYTKADQPGSLGLCALNGKSLFKDVEYQVLDGISEPPSDPPTKTVGIVNGDFTSKLTGWEKEGETANFLVFTFKETNTKAFTTGPGGKFKEAGRIYQTFVVPNNAKKLECYLHGSSSPTTYVVLREGSKVHWKQSGPNRQEPARYEWDLTNLRGKQVTFEIVDSNRGNYGYIGVHGIRILPESNSEK